MRRLAALLLLLTGSAAAVELLGTPPDPRQVQAGRGVAAGASRAGAQGACFTCHGFDGAGQQAAAFPALAGQSADYLYAQLEAYASGARKNEIMQPIAERLTPQQRRDVSVFYAAQPPRPPERPGVAASGDAALLQWGGTLSAIGSAERGVQACQNCHGPAGIGMGPAYPRLAGQVAEYISASLAAYQREEREDTPRRTMTNIAKALSAEDIRAVALYFASVRTEPVTPGRGVLR